MVERAFGLTNSTQFICLQALAITANKIIKNNYLVKSQQPDSVNIALILMKLDEIDGLATEDLPYLKGISGTEILVSDILKCLK
ncbi:hypothetical protein [Lysinibacillus parviboronicapiens]|uniref:hypothetical protein n=1 Tax=Lysinibacillus parviboronicapiens TaxID=436516 RepID=UPI000D332DAB|nr:hypothetical protein [Lysinibacillus parviboronicapiens]